MFVDVTLPTYEIDVSQLEAARSEKTRAIMIAHTLGNVFDLDAVTAFAKKHDLWLIEDCCDALGSTWKGRQVGTFGDIATVSFYPAHHITMGEGGAVLTDKPNLQVLIESFRDWGRDCWCEPGKDNTCGKRFDWQLGALPCGYDHKYTYSHIGYNLKATDMQAALGRLADREAAALHRAPQGKLSISFQGFAAVGRLSCAARGDAGLRPVVVRLPDRSAGGRALQAARPGARSGSEEDRHATAVRRQSATPAGLRRLRVPRGRRPHEHRFRHEQRLLDRRLSRPDRGDAGLRGGDDYKFGKATETNC